MTPFRVVRLAIVLALGFWSAGAIPADADPWIEMTKCDQVLVGGVAHPHVQFRVTNAGSFALYTVVMRSPDPNAPQDSCHTFTLDNPPGWSSFRRSDGGGQWATTFGTDTHIGAGNSLDGFGATLSGTQCCFRFVFLNAFGEVFGDSHFCFQCDPPTPALSKTWGQLKSSYR